jgi:xanthine dehydrogenase/oxidase
MGLYAKLRSDASPTVSSLSSCLDGNLCRCTGYRPIIDAIRSFATDLRTRPEFEEYSKRKMNGLVVTDSWSNAARLSSLSPEASERIRKNQSFPEELKTLLRSRNGSRSIRVVGRNRAAWAQPSTLRELLDLKSQHGSEARIVVGNTEIGIELHLNKRKTIPLLVSLSDIPEMHELRFDDLKKEHGSVLHVGGAVTLSRLELFLKRTRNEDMMPRPEQRRGLDAIQDMLRWFASTQIRNVAGLASNIVNASPISDLCPVCSCFTCRVFFCLLFLLSYFTHSHTHVTC